MVILGIDPGSRKAGFALIKQDGNRLEYLSSGVMKYPTTGEFVDRLGEIFNSCENLMQEYRPDHVAIESLIYVKSIPALSKLAQARGAMVAAFAHHKQGKIFEYAPNLIKSTVTGHGHSGKDGVEKALGLLFGKREYKTDDESDALAIAVCHALNFNTRLSAFKRERRI